MQILDEPDNLETEEAKALLGEGIKTCRKIVTNYREALLSPALPGEDRDEAGAAGAEQEP